MSYFFKIAQQIEQRAHIGEIFARWHLAIAITSNMMINHPRPI